MTKKMADLRIGDSFYYGPKLLRVRGKYFTTNAGYAYVPVEHNGMNYELRCDPEMEIDVV